MAMMFPERLPADIESDAERRLFEEFRTGFSNDFTVFARVAWLSKQRGQGTFDGEADLVVAHPRHGVLVIEVKGGGIEHDAHAGRWYSTDRHGTRHQIKDPFQQARNSMHVLRRKLGEAAPTARFRYPTAYAVAFPDVHYAEEPGVDVASEIVLDLQKMRQLKQSIIEVYRFFRRDDPDPGPDAIEALTALLGSTWKVETVLGASLDAQEVPLRELTDQQFRVLDLLDYHPQALISGGAGTGKTLLALEKARRLARAGFRVLFTCFNVNLAAWARTQLADQEAEVNHFHGLCYEFTERAGARIERTHEDSDATFFARFPDALLDAASKSGERFDAIVVDEGQDFEEEWWVALTSLLANPEDGILYIFYDDNQRIYRRQAAFPVKGPPFPLTENCRNTRAIHELVLRFYEGTSPATCQGPPGLAPHPIDVKPGQDEIAAVSEHIDWLIGEEIAPQDIAILTPRSRERSSWRTSPSSRWSLTWDLQRGTNQVACSTIHAFKGLERPVVIVTELADIEPAKRAELLYVAFSRARQYLAVSGLDLAAVAEMEQEANA